MRVHRTHTKQLRAPLTTTLGYPTSTQCNFNSCSFNCWLDYSISREDLQSGFKIRQKKLIMHSSTILRSTIIMTSAGQNFRVWSDSAFADIIWYYWRLQQWMILTIEWALEVYRKITNLPVNKVTNVVTLTIPPPPISISLHQSFLQVNRVFLFQTLP